METCLKMDAFPWDGIANQAWSCTTPDNSMPLPLHLPTVIAFIAPRRFDVLFGKGRVLREYTGNVRANVLVAMFRPKYEQAHKHEKIAKHIVDIIHESHGRFLKFEESEGCWVEVEKGMAREKISHIFRNQRGRKRRNDRAGTMPLSIFQ
jgi:hypothetical protein